MIQHVSNEEQRRVRSRHVLLVEDSADEVTLFERALRASDLSPTLDVAHDVDAAASRLFAEGTESAMKRPDLVIVDMKLSRDDGMSLVRRIRADARMRRTPVVLLTASVEEDDRRQAYALGANSYIQKPTNFAMLEDIVRQICVYWLVVNRPAPLIMGEFT